MRRRTPGPIVALILLAVLGAAVYLLEFRGREEKDRADRDKDRVLQFERSGVTALALKNEHGAIRVEKEGEGWTVTAPLKTAADREAVEGLLSSLESARVERRLGDAGDRSAYGLDPPKATLTLESATGTTRTLALGDGNPIGGTFYALLPDTSEAAVVTSPAGDFAARDLLSLRDKQLLELDPWKIRRLRIERGRDTVHLERPDDGWSIRRPIEAPADGPTITDLLTALQGLRAREFVAESPSPAELRRFGLSPPAARMTLFQEGWDVEKTILFGAKQGEDRYARTVGREPVLTVPGDFWEKVSTRVFDLRRKELIDVSQYRIESLTAAEAGGPALVVTRGTEGGWAASGAVSGEVKGESVDALLQAIGNLKATAFIDRAPDAERAALSRRPALDLTLREEAGAEGKAPRSQHLVFGPPARGLVKVRDLAWRPIALAPDHQVAAVREALAGVRRDATAPKPPAEPAAAGETGDDGAPPAADPPAPAPSSG
ncbi:MAG: DUF4340 domain-containing protein, partial [Candidatus Polarisedimenticolia bacterium]